MDAGQISDLLAARAEELCAVLLPGGKRQASHWLAGSVGGEAGKSLVVHLDTGSWKDWATAEHHGDLIDLWRFSRGCSLGEAIRATAQWLNVEHHTPAVPRARIAKPKQELKPASQHWLDLQRGLRRGTISELDALACQRGLPSFAGLELASRAGQLHFADVHDDGFDWPAWILTDPDRINAQARRVDGKRWTKHDIKAKTIPGITGLNASWPIGLSAAAGKDIALVEGGPDMLAAWHLIWAEERTREITPVCIPGTSHRIPDLALPLFAGKTIWMYADNDAAGAKASEMWTAQLREVGCAVHSNPLSLDGAKDLNEALAEPAM